MLMGSCRDEILSNGMSDEEACQFAWLLTGSAVVPMALRTTIELGLLEVMDRHRQQGIPLLSPAEIAAQLPTNNPGAPAMLDRLLRFLASKSIVTCSSATTRDGKTHRRYGLSSTSKFLLGDQDGASFSPLLLALHDKVYMEPWYYLKDAVLEGGVPFNRAYGMNVFDYHGTDPRFNQLFDKAMHHQSTIIMKKILETYTGFQGLHSLVDVGGGTGAILSLITARYPKIKGFNFDMPHVIKDAPKFTGVEHVAGDMFSSVPTGDAIFMKWILHDWEDEYCVKLLENCCKALPENGKVIVVEMVVPDIVGDCSTASGVFQLDLFMMTLNQGGKERTVKEFEALAKAAGFARIEPICSAYNFWVLEFYKNNKTNNFK